MDSESSLPQYTGYKRVDGATTPDLDDDSNVLVDEIEEATVEVPFDDDEDPVR